MVQYIQSITSVHSILLLFGHSFSVHVVKAFDLSPPGGDRRRVPVITKASASASAPTFISANTARSAFMGKSDIDLGDDIASLVQEVEETVAEVENALSENKPKKDTTKSRSRFGSAHIMDLIPESTTLFFQKGGGQVKGKTQEKNPPPPSASFKETPITKLRNQQKKNLSLPSPPSTTETPINKLLGQNIISQEDNNNFIVTKDVFENIKEQSFKKSERIENAKAFLVGFLFGGLVVSPIVALQDIVSEISALSEGAITAFQFDTVFCSFQCALFAMLLRYYVQNDDQMDYGDYSALLKNGFVVSSALLRTLIMSSNGDLGWQMIPNVLVSGLESFVMFTAVFASFDYGCKTGFLSRSCENAIEQ